VKEAVLEVQDLTVAYGRPSGGENIVVSGVTLSLERGRVLGLAGESGCGKSTLALAAIGYQAPGSRVCEGSSQLDGVDLVTLSTRNLRRLWGNSLSHVAQGASLALNPATPVGRQLAQVLTLHMGLRGSALRERQLELFEAVGLPEAEKALDRYPHQFSGGQQQRIAIAIALACRPKVLILDEPTTGLDVTTQQRITALLRTLLADSGTAALYVSHDLALLSTIADRLAVMYAGEVVEEGPTAMVVGQPRHPYTQALLAAAPAAHERRGVAGIGGQPPPRAILDSCAFAPRCQHALDVCRSGHVAMHTVGAGHAARCVRVAELAARPDPVAVLASLPAGKDALLEVEDLWCTYANASGRPAVQAVSLVVAHAETLGIVGESGSGKSTLLRAIVGLHPPAKGTIRFAGDVLARSAVERPRPLRGRIQLVFQNADSSLNPRQTIEEILSRPLRLFRDDLARRDERREIVDLLDAVKLHPSLVHRYPSELSGGQKQRVALARAFASQPSLLLCDEVTSALDVSVQATIIDLIAELSARLGTAVVFVSHDLGVVRTIARRAMVMKDGETCEQGETEQLFARPAHPYSQELLAAVPRLPSREPRSEQAAGRHIDSGR